MKKLFYILSLLCALLIAAPASATITLTQVKANSACSGAGTTCAVSVTSTGAGHALFAGMIGGDTTTNPLTGVTAGACSGSWVHCPNCSAGAAAGSVDGFYCLSATGGSTTITLTRTNTNGNGWIAIIFEVQTTLSGFAL